MTSLYESFEQNGYIVLEGVLQDAVSIKKSLEEFMAQPRDDENSDWNSSGFVLGPAHSDGQQRVQKVQSVGLFFPDILDTVFRHEALQKAMNEVSPLAGHDMFGTKFFPMYPGATSVHWHQDNHFFGTASPHIVSCAVYLEETTVANGCLRVIPKSHLSGVVQHDKGEGIWANGEWATDVDESHAVDIIVPPGSIVLFNALLLHAAHVNTSVDRTRFSLFCHFLPSNLEFSWRGTNFSRGAYKDRYPV